MGFPRYLPGVSLPAGRYRRRNLLKVCSVLKYSFKSTYTRRVFFILSQSLSHILLTMYLIVKVIDMCSNSIECFVLYLFVAFCIDDVYWSYLLPT